ncbi:MULTISPECIES: SCO family protein [unclassified Bradyrhizobium]|uniref:SCO family protein n=1 Tax=unclassified Bradyrhizobium TaxID=2631580 RepID=UPI00247854D7|nr:MULTISPECIES: SCO family protein [unclassified Bradyrhizobium]WGR72677.1 SCO family protein [Bradyrhizobium sp. ISRA426]WGR77510.1 SCO family protein [Bradyrhizobium sp. ISRA430]WGR87916.1 SCO family protein [Bradyrhizobium sp. ISRA432]
MLQSAAEHCGMVGRRAPPLLVQPSIDASAKRPRVLVAGWLTTLMFCITMPLMAQAAVTASQLEQVALVPRDNAQLPLSTLMNDLDGRTAPLQSWLAGIPTVWILADYTCETLCGPAISIVSNALADTGLRAGEDFRLIVAGLDPKDTVAQALVMKNAQLSTRCGLPGQSYFLRAAATDVSSLTDAFGVRTICDREHDQFAHPAAAFVVTPDGRISRTLSALAVDATSLRLAVVEAGQGHIGRWTDQVHLLCYGFDPTSGTYTLAARRLLFAASSISVIVLAVLIWLLLRRECATR